MNTKKIVEELNKARARELRVIIQYMLQHYVVTGIESLPVADLFKNTALTEMKHAESLGERIDYLGGVPTKTPDPITVGSEVREMLEIDAKAEEDAIEMYRDIVKLCLDEGDHATRIMMEEILEQEEEHDRDFLTALGR